MDTDELRLARHKAIEKFFEDNAELFAIQEDDEIEGGPFHLRDWALLTQTIDMGTEDPLWTPEILAVFFRPGMGYSQKIGMIQSIEESIRHPHRGGD